MRRERIPEYLKVCMAARVAVLLIILILFCWTTNSPAIPPTPPAQILLPENLQGEDAPLAGKSLPIQIRMNEPIVSLEVSATQQQIVRGKASFEQPAPVVIMNIRQKDLKKTHSEQQIPLKLSKPGYYLIDIRITGKSVSGVGFSDRLTRYVIVSEKGAVTIISPMEYNRRIEKEREQRFLNENKKNPDNHPIRALFEDTVAIPGAARSKIRPYDVPTNRRMEVRPEGPSEFLRKHSVDRNATSWTSQDPITVRGRLLFQDIDNVWKPLVNVSVNLWDSDFGLDEHLGVVCTDWDGRWSFTVNNDDGWFQDGRDIYYTFKLSNTRLSTGSCGFLAGPYEWKSAVHNNLSDGAVLDFGDETASTTMESLQVWSTLNLAWNHAVVSGGWDPGKIDSCYPSSGTFYNGKVNIAAADNDGPDSITHEYAHGLMAHAYTDGDPSPGGAHGFGDCNQNRALSWSEGWATAFMLSVRPDNRYNWHQGDTGQELELFSSTCHLGETSEGWVVAALLDMMDAHNDDNGGILNRGRNGASDHNARNQVALATMLRDTMVGSSHHNDALEFWNSLSGELNATPRNLAQEIMYYNWMSVSMPITCVAVDVATMREKNPVPLLSGLRKFRDLALKNWEHGRELINMYYRNNPEIALTLLGKPQLIPDALYVIRHFSTLGDVIGNHQAYLEMMANNPVVIPDEVATSIDAIFRALDEKGSAELKADVDRVRKDVTELKGMRMQQLQERVTRMKAEPIKKRTAIRQNGLTPASEKALKDPQMQEVLKAKLPRQKP
jgi:hypothetical protein